MIKSSDSLDGTTIIKAYCKLFKVEANGLRANAIVRLAEGITMSRADAIAHMRKAISKTIASRSFCENESQLLCLSVVDDAEVIGDSADSSPTYKRLGFNSYKQYLQSDLWKSIRRRVFHRDGSCCVLCQKPAAQAHHRSYDYSTMSGNDITMIISLCCGCHHKIEFDKRNKKRSSHEVEAYLVSIMTLWQDKSLQGMPTKPKREKLLDADIIHIANAAKEKPSVKLNSRHVMRLILELQELRRISRISQD
jgi:cytochrome c553